MKNFTGSKTLLSAIFMFIPFSAMSHNEQQNCGFVEEYEEVYIESYDMQDDPFIDIDVTKSIAGLPEASKAKAQEFFDALDKLDARTANEENISVDDEVRFEVLEHRLDELFITAGVEYVEIDLLAKLTDENQLKAFKLMRKLEQLESEEDVEKALLELDELLELSYTI